MQNFKVCLFLRVGFFQGKMSRCNRETHPWYKTNTEGKCKSMWLNNNYIKASKRKSYLGKDLKTDLVEKERKKCSRTINTQKRNFERSLASDMKHNSLLMLVE